ncbi:B3 domain-containing transcription factor VRN1 [Spatholobus suberectus]|nr:B3 domain-containing transcription factor VRN1 [Spatholobus suberectus]
MLPIRFFKIILKTNLERLKTPNKFVRKYGDGLPNPVFMKPPDGTEWEVYWAKQDGEVWLEKGWKEFVVHYSLDEGHLIFFKYEGTSKIDVLILDPKSALEIDYPSCAEKDNLDNSDNEWPDQKPKHVRGENPTQRTSSLNWPTQTRAQEVARNFISSNPFFTLFIKPVHVVERKLYVPDLKGIIENKKNYVMLQLGERSWNVKLLRCHILSAGWPLFASESELQPGDVCVFELINREDSVFKVHVFKRHS